MDDQATFVSLFYFWKKSDTKRSFSPSCRNWPICIPAYICIPYVHLHTETRHILRRPRGEAKGLGELGNKAISRIPKLINCRRSTQCILILLRVLNIVSDVIVVLCGAPRPILIVSPPAPHMVKLVGRLLVLLHLWTLGYWALVTVATVVLPFLR